MPKTAVSDLPSLVLFTFISYNMGCEFPENMCVGPVVESYLSQIQWQYTTPSDTTTLCPYKGKAEYYNLRVHGKDIKDAIWWYRYPTHESAPIAGMACFYNEKVDVFVDGVKEEK